MKALIIYDSIHGNTEKIAHAISQGLNNASTVVNVVNTSMDLKSFDLIVVGCPTHGGRPTKSMQTFLNDLNKSSLEGVNIATFDTRIKATWVKIFGFAAGRISNTLKEKGGKLIETPEGFFVKGTEGPILEGELDRATAWGKNLAEKSV